MSFTVPLKFFPKQKASMVEVAGSFNNWTKVPMKMTMKSPGTPGECSISLKLSPGTHEYKFIVDGEWEHDPDSPNIDDNKGGFNNQITVAGDLSKEDVEFLVKTTDKSEEDVKSYYKLFRMRHPTGHIDMKEYKKMTTDFVMHMSSKCNPDVVCDYAFKSYDKDQNGFISFKEAAHAMYVHRDDGSKEEKAKFAFHMYDINKSGAVEKKELSDWLKGIMVLMGEKLGKNDLDELEIELEKTIGQLDTNKDGIISQEEFVRGCIEDEDLFDNLCCYGEFLAGILTADIAALSPVDILKGDLEKLELKQELEELEEMENDMKGLKDELMGLFT